MTRSRLAPLCALLLASLATAPTAAATSPACEAWDLAGWYNLAHEDGTTEEVEWLDETRPGDHVWMQGGAELWCEGQLVSVVVYACSDGEVSVVAYEEAFATQPTAGADFTYFEATFDLPAGPYAAEVWFGEPHAGVLLDFTAHASCLPPPDCPADLQARANDDGSITLTWEPSPGAQDYYVMRMDDEEEGWQRVAVTENATWTDVDTQEGHAYRYWVMAHADGRFSEDCPIVDATAVPFLGAPLLVALALVGSVGAYAWLRRRGA